MFTRSKTTSHRPGKENGFDQIDRKVGMAWSRFWGVVLGLGGLVFAWNTLTADSFAFASRWPGLLAAAVLFALARYCWRSKEGMLSQLSDVGVKR